MNYDDNTILNNETKLFIELGIDSIKIEWKLLYHWKTIFK